MVMKSWMSALVLTLGALAATAVPEQAEARRGRCGNCGVVTSVDRDYEDRGHTSGGGAVIGAIVGGALGNQVGKGDGRKAATVAGAVAGGVVGHNVEKNNNRGGRSLCRVEVRMDNGDYRTVESYNRPDVRRGDSVQVSGNRVYRMR